MRIFFIGTVDFSFVALETLIKHGHRIVGVATKEASVFNSDFNDLTPLCIDQNIPYKHVNDINHEKNIAFIRQLNPEIIYCFGWSSLIKAELLSIPKIGVVGYHPALLPYNRGRHPIIWALALGLDQTGSTFFFMDEGADTGDIVSQEIIPISKTDTAYSLYSKIIDTAIPQILEFTKQFEQGVILSERQPSGVGNTWRKRGKSDGRIDFRMNSERIYNLVRALTKPYVGAHFECGNEDIKVFESRISDCDLPNIEPGKILEAENDWIKVKTADSAIWLKLDCNPEQILNYDYL
jgi:methionyl-tRNA formyltransferase